MFRTRWIFCVLLLAIFPAKALERPEVTFKVFQFPANMIPRIDGNDDDWAMVPNSYAIGMDQLEDTEAPGGHGTNRNAKDMDVKVKVGWVKGLNRLYFLYEASITTGIFHGRICTTTSLKWLWMAMFRVAR